MFQSITWGQYFTTIIITAGLYYLAIAAIYFRSELITMLQRKKAVVPVTPVPAKENKADLFSVSGDVKTALQQLFEQAAERRWIKEELLMGLCNVLKQFPELKGTAFQSAMNNYISVEATTQCEIELNEPELHKIWSV